MYAELFCGLLGKLVRVDTVQAVLVGMGDMLVGESMVSILFLRGEGERGSWEEREGGAEEEGAKERGKRGRI